MVAIARRGSRSGESGSRQATVDAARSRFTRDGYAAQAGRADERGDGQGPGDAAGLRRRLGRHIERALLNVRVPYGTSGKEYLWLTDVRRNPDGSYDGIVTGEVLHISDLHEGSSYHAARSVAVD